MQEEHPRKQIEVWFQEEARFPRQGALTQVWGEKGSRPTAVKQTECEWCYLFGAVNPNTGKSSAMLAPSVNTDFRLWRIRSGPQPGQLHAAVGVAVERTGLDADPGAPGLLVKLIKTGAKVVRQSKYVTFQMAEAAVPRKIFAAILARLRKWAAKARAASLPAAT